LGEQTQNLRGPLKDPVFFFETTYFYLNS